MGRKKKKKNGGGTSATNPWKRIYLREWREFQGFVTQDDLAAASGITRATISRLETGSLQYRQWHLQELAKALGCTPGELIENNPWEASSIIMLYKQMPVKKKEKALRAVKEIAEET